MTNDVLTSMPKKDILFGAKQTLQNAKTLFESAEQLALSSKFGTANSLMILSIEESVKSMILISGFLNIKIDFDIEPFFKNHKTKHKEAAKMQDFINKFSLFKNALISAFSKRDSLFDFFLQLGVSSILSSIDNRPDRFSTWYANANNQKNNGLYVGYQNFKWSLPINITQLDFQEARGFAKPFLDSLELIDHIKESDYKLFEDLNDPESEISKAQKPFKLLPAEDHINFDLDNYKEV